MISDSKYAKLSTEQLEVIYTRADSEEKELVKEELSRRYFNYYLGLMKNPGPPPPLPGAPGQGELAHPTGAPVSSEEESAPAPPHPHKKPPSLEESLASLTPVAPISLRGSPRPDTADNSAAPDDAEKKRKRRFCFIATAAYGSPLAREVILLQDFRDRRLARSCWGEKCIQAYYRFSPALAGRISQSHVLKFLTRCLLAPLIFLVKRGVSRPPSSGRH
jgi:hypothetical protein